MKNKFITITIDGHSACGKNSVGFSICKQNNFFYLDSGLLFRLFSAVFDPDVRIENTIEWDKYLYIDDQNIFYKNTNMASLLKSEETAAQASKLGAIPEISTYMLQVQRDILQKIRSNTEYLGIIITGRNGGTFVFPEADIKFFFTATPEIRAYRRFNEVCKERPDITLENIYNEIVNRDKNDANRIFAKLESHPEAIIIDTSTIDKIKIFEMVNICINKKIAEQ